MERWTRENKWTVEGEACTRCGVPTPGGERRITGETDEAGRAGDHMCLPFYRYPLEAQTHTSTWSPSARLAWLPSTVRHIKWRFVMTTGMITGQLSGSHINSSQLNLNRNICKASCLFRTAITSHCFLR